MSDFFVSLHGVTGDASYLAFARRVADDTLDAASVTGDLGRFSEGKLEFAAGNADATVSARAATLLEELRSR